MVCTSQQCKYCKYVLSAYNINWSEVSGWLFFSSPQCNGNQEKTKPEEGQAVTYLAAMQSECTEDW